MGRWYSINKMTVMSFWIVYYLIWLYGRNVPLGDRIISFDNTIEMSLREGLTLPCLISTWFVNFLQIFFMLKNVIWCHCRCLYMLRVLLSVVHILTFVLIVTHILPRIWMRYCWSYYEFFLKNFDDFLASIKSYQFWGAPRPFDFSILI